MEKYGYEKINLPVLENKRVQRVVNKLVNDRRVVQVGTGKLAAVLRSNFEVSIIRAYLENEMVRKAHPVKIYTSGNSYYIDKSSSKNYQEEFVTQLASIGARNPILDVMQLQIVTELLFELKIKKISVLINSIGDDATRESYARALSKFIKHNQKNLCKECKKLVNKDVFSIFDCEKTRCKNVLKSVPSIESHYSDESKAFYKKYKTLLKEADIDFITDKGLLKCSEFYTGPVFEIRYQGELLAKGGRHDDLFKQLGGRHNTITGLSIYLDKIIKIFRDEQREVKKKKKSIIFLAHLGEKAKAKSLSVYRDLIRSGMNVREALVKDTLRSQLIIADRLNAQLLLIMGQKEAMEDTIIIRELSSGIQQVLSRGAMVESIRQRLKKI